MITLSIFASVALISLISFVGALTLVLNRSLLQKSIFILVSLAVGALLGDVFVHIIPEAFESTESPLLVSLAIIGGIIAFFILEKVLHWHHQHSASHAEEFPHPIGKLLLVSDGAHNFIDGVIIAASYMVSIEVGIATTIAVVLHEIPQEIGNFGVLLHAGYSKAKALWFNFLSALTAFAGAGLAVLLGSLSEQFALWLLPIAGGGFIYVALSDLIPELHKNKRASQGIIQVIAIIVGIATMTALLGLEG